MNNKALLIVDVQNDFCPGGALAVPEGDKVVAVLNGHIAFCAKNKIPIFASRDWHPMVTAHFREFGGLWPVHCVQKTKGAGFHSKLKLPKSTIILSKGVNPKGDSYSAFQAVDKNNCSFGEILKKMNVQQLYVGGLATDYCVKASVLDARKLGLDVQLLIDAVKGVNLKPDDSENAIKEMINCGAQTITLAVLKKFSNN